MLMRFNLPNRRRDIDRLAPMGGGWWANVIAPFFTALLAALLIAFGAAAFLRLLGPVSEVIR